MLADTVDYGEWKTGVRCMAVTTCANTMGQKLGTGIGTALFGLALSMTGYDGLAEVQPATAISCINFMVHDSADYRVRGRYLFAYQLQAG